MRPVTITTSGTGPTAMARVDYRQPNFKIGVGCVATGTVTYTLEHTFNGTDWFPNATTASIVNIDSDTNYAFPIWGVRLNVASGAGSVEATLLQGS
jgi:hypothetical protein